MKRTALIIIALLLAGLAVTIYLMYTHEMPDRVAVDPDYSLTARELLLAFEKDQAAANLQYIDKIIQVAGTVTQVDTAGALILGDHPGSGEIIMAVDPRYKHTLLAVSNGSMVTVQGVCSGYTKSDAASDDLLSDLGVTIRFRSGGVKQ